MPRGVRVSTLTMTESMHTHACEHIQIYSQSYILPDSADIPGPMYHILLNSDDNNQQRQMTEREEGTKMVSRDGRSRAPSAAIHPVVMKMMISAFKIET